MAEEVPRRCINQEVSPILLAMVESDSGDMQRGQQDGMGRYILEGPVARPKIGRCVAFSMVFSWFSMDVSCSFMPFHCFFMLFACPFKGVRWFFDAVRWFGHGADRSRRCPKGILKSLEEDVEHRVSIDMHM